MVTNLYNNIGIGSIAILAVLNHSLNLPISKITLVIPIISHKELLAYLSRTTTTIKSIEKLIVDKISCFSNFNNRYYDNLPLTIEVIQFLTEMELAHYGSGLISKIHELQYRNSMGARAGKIFQASKNISKILAEDSENLYLNLRIKL